MGPVTAVTFAGAEPQTGWRGPESYRQPLCCRRGNQPLYVRHVFLFVFLFLFLSNVGEGECFPSHPPAPSFLSSHKSIQTGFSSSPPPLFSCRSSFVRLFAQTASISAVVLRPPSHSPPFYLSCTRFQPQMTLFLQKNTKKFTHFKKKHPPFTNSLTHFLMK